MTKTVSCPQCGMGVSVPAREAPAWRLPPIPASMEGKAALVTLRESAMRAAGFEYYGEVVAAICYDTKLVSTYPIERIDLDMVAAWRPIG